MIKKIQRIMGGNLEIAVGSDGCGCTCILPLASQCHCYTDIIIFSATMFRSVFQTECIPRRISSTFCCSTFCYSELMDSEQVSQPGFSAYRFAVLSRSLAMKLQVHIKPEPMGKTQHDATLTSHCYAFSIVANQVA